MDSSVPWDSDKPCPAHQRVAGVGEGGDVDVGVTSWHCAESPSAPREKVPSEAPVVVTMSLSPPHSVGWANPDLLGALRLPGPYCVLRGVASLVQREGKKATRGHDSAHSGSPRGNSTAVQTIPLNKSYDYLHSFCFG